MARMGLPVSWLAWGSQGFDRDSKGKSRHKIQDQHATAGTS